MMQNDQILYYNLCPFHDAYWDNELAYRQTNFIIGNSQKKKKLLKQSYYC